MALPAFICSLFFSETIAENPQLHMTAWNRSKLLVVEIVLSENLVNETIFFFTFSNFHKHERNYVNTLWWLQHHLKPVIGPGEGSRRLDTHLRPEAALGGCDPACPPGGEPTVGSGQQGRCPALTDGHDLGGVPDCSAKERTPVLRQWFLNMGWAGV